MADDLVAVEPLDSLTFDWPAATGVAIAAVEEGVRRFNLRVASGQEAAVGEIIGLALPDAIGDYRELDGKRLLKLGPDEWYLTYAKGAEVPKAGATLGGQGSLIDISDRDTGLTIRGEHAALTLAGGCPLDLWKMRSSGLRTVFEGVTVVIWKHGPDDFELAFAGTFAPFVHAVLTRIVRHRLAEDAV